MGTCEEQRTIVPNVPEILDENEDRNCISKCYQYISFALLHAIGISTSFLTLLKSDLEACEIR